MRPRSVINKGIQYKITAMGRIFTLGERYIAAIYNPKDTSLKITAEAVCVADEEERNTIPFTFSKYDTDRLKAGWATIEIYDSNMTQMAFRDNFAVIRPNSIKISGPQTYTIQFFGENEATPLQVLQVTEGETPVYAGPTPTKAGHRVSEDTYVSYEFIGWSPSIHAASENEDYHAVFTEIYENLISCVFRNYDGTPILPYVQYVRSGEIPIPPSTDPTRPDEIGSRIGHHYIFSGWSPELGPVTEDTSFVAQYYDEVYEYVEDVALGDDGYNRYDTYSMYRLSDMSIFHVGQKFRLVPIHAPASAPTTYGTILAVGGQPARVYTDVNIETIESISNTPDFRLEVIVEESESV